MKIVDMIASPGLTGFYFDDQQAIKAGAGHDGFAYTGAPVTPGFRAVRQRGESISVMLILEDGQVAFGDCAAVQYSGAGGRDPLFLAHDFIPMIMEELRPKLVGKELDSFRKLADSIEHSRRPTGEPYHTAIRYGVSQAILDGVAKAKKLTMTEVILGEYQLPLVLEPVPIFTQTGDERYANADKAIIKRAGVLPHALINNVETKLGKHGELLLEYVNLLRERVIRLGDEAYWPILHIDVYGTIGMAFADDVERMVEYFGDLEKAAEPFPLRIEGPMDAGNKEGQLKQLKRLREALKEAEVKVEVVADEWCNTYEEIVEFVDAQAADMVQIKTPDLGGIQNTIEAVLYARKFGVGAYVGGSCNETDAGGRTAVHVALATRPDQMLAKPGMGVDEGYMIVHNEMNRTLELLRYKAGLKASGCKS
ncbi:methylaspartate ammonia-lyase [Desulfitobacterium sp. LBE]|uniref:methylaspartate ammonia-lyase n=3 Tax=root TaxID=1 RepID=A0A098B3F3_DESHA|nr:MULTISPECIES: methylaspartate ammonia-lyase [Desulfitobacterium]ACL22405.1 Methylaspartate ammonia-lyase [Desulfitobacterium hafniense DCB-2]MEA5023952.1 methylaspartate ammonia-lyase [Desulfitobacterium hafniense]TWH59811.1 methylaspartate ammonia-lyase [Desulfitobacterium sp. LBE]CDX03369.1 Methylaspartate ammonia-lyase [Desulfitobacterium hafniense]